MTNILGEYKNTIAEVSERLGVSPSWIVKVRKLTSVAGGIGKQGKKSTLSQSDIKELAVVKLLRAMNLDYNEIKTINGIENEIIRLYKKMKPPKSSVATVRLLIHCDVLVGQVDSGKRKQLAELISKYGQISKRVYERMGIFKEVLKYFSGDLFVEEVVDIARKS